MNLFRGIKEYFFGKEDSDDINNDTHERYGHSQTTAAGLRSGSRSVPHQPVLQEAGYSGSGGIQGLSWYAKTLQVDEQGDFAHGFYGEAAPSQPPQAPTSGQHSVAMVDGGNVVIVN